MFSHIQLYRLDPNWAMNSSKLESILAQRPFQPCGSQDVKSMGWVPPQEGGAILHAQGGNWLLCLCIEKKSVPSSAVKKLLAERVKLVLDREGRSVGRKESREMKEAIIQELLPRAFPKQEKISAWIDVNNGWLAINASSPAKAEEVITAIRQDVEPAPTIKLVSTESSPAGAMSTWLVTGDAPVGFTVDRECELKDGAGDKATVKYAHLSLEREEIHQHIAEGKLPTRLAMTWNDRMSFVLTDNMQIKKVSFLEIVMEEMHLDAEDADALFHSSFALMTGELQKFFPDLIDALGGETEPA